jgi:hypothetical protein
MGRIYTHAEKPFDQVRFSAIAIRAIDASQRHIGILHKESAEKEPLLLHLAMHCNLRNGHPTEGYLWVDPPIPAPRLRQVAAICRLVWRSNGRNVPYAFSAPNDCFDEASGRFLLGPTKFGLTCATFVLAVFHTAGVQLVEYGTWPIGRPGDEEWQTAVIALIQASGQATAEHLDAMKTETGRGAARYRPEEVAGAALLNTLPARFQQAVDASRDVLQRLESVGSS